MEKILIIDDEKDITEMISDFLSSKGYTVTTAQDGEEGLKKFDAENPDIVICDIMMPKMNGFQFIKELRATKRWVPVIIISALNDTSEILKSYELEADYYIVKSIDLNDILKAVKVMSYLIPLRKK